MPYIQERIYDESELGLSGIKDWLKTGVDWLKEGAKSDLLGQKQPQVPAYVPPPQESFMQKYGPLVLIGGAGLVIFLIVRSKKK